MKKLILILCVFIVSGWNNSAEAKGRFGVNLGATMVTGGASTELTLPSFGGHYHVDTGRTIGYSIFLEYQPFRVCLSSICGTVSYLALTPLLNFNLGRVVYLGIGPVFKYATNDSDNQIGVHGAFALGLNFSRNIFFEARTDFDFTPSQGSSIFDTLLWLFQVGYRFGN